MSFSFEERPSDSPYVKRIWRARTESVGTLISQAATHCEMVVTRYKGKTTVTVRGPETKARPLPVHSVGAEYFGITFITGAFIPQLPPKELVNHSDVNLPEASNQSFWLDSSTWQIPNYENVDTFIDKLVRENLLVHEPVVEAVLKGGSPGLSIRSVQYRFLQATGLTLATIRQIKRARLAAALLEQGVSILDTVHLASYSDQPHLTRALKRYIGQTPAQIARMSQTAYRAFT
jgi:AraC-like DNA-binding protein